ncbi:protein 5NUC-like isoform X6 [Danaus plexippus]|uniref:protein 5NUC-like isoform X6 n=1 Tax=Danaus plexippus TaxID=13037 RepID=UPI002AB06607|nr:protein 5NUC-like isoform X6 [Danaus plexippus]
MEKILFHLTTVLATITLSFSSIVKPPSNDGKNFELLILHNNDMHARFEQTSQLSGACTTLDREAGKCYGGFPRVATVVKEARRKAASGEGPPVLYLNAGDTYTGTAWFTIYKWKVAAEFLNALQPDAVSLGSNELEKGSSRLSPFLDNLNSPVLACNVIVNSMETKQKIQKSIVKDMNGVKVAIVGYLELDSNILDSTGYIEYIDEVIALKEEATKLKAQGVKIIVALGHSIPEKNIEIATEVENIDLIISGHRNMFYSNGSNTEMKLEQILQPVIITQKSGKKIPIFHSFTYDKYLGKIHAVFDPEGNLKVAQSNPILLDKTIKQSVDMSEIIKKYSDEQTTSLETIIGDTVVVIDGSNCMKEECNLGNLITDSMMFYYATRYEGEHWTDAPIAIINGGSLSGTLSPLIRPFPVRRSDLINFLPGPSNLVTVTMSGTLLQQMLEESVANYTLNNTSGQFLQFSGIRVIYDISKDPGSRVMSAVIRCWDCDIPEFFELQEERLYKIIIPSTLVSVSNGYSMLVNLTKENLGYDAVATVTEFIQKRSPVYPEIADRIVLLNVPEFNEHDSAASTKISLAIFIYTIFTIAVVR